jgi:hypothetical protein
MSFGNSAPAAVILGRERGRSRPTELSDPGEDGRVRELQRCPRRIAALRASGCTLLP